VVIEVAVARICETLRTWGFKASKTLFGGSHSFSAAKHGNKKKKNWRPNSRKTSIKNFGDELKRPFLSLSPSVPPSVCVDLLSLFVLED
jgi:hypothetical protein